MSRFKVRMKLQGFELEIDGSKDDIPAIGQHIGAQLANLIEPTIGIADGDTAYRSGASGRSTLQQPIIEATARKKTGRRKPNNGGSTQTSDSGAIALDFVHDSQKFGMPNQGWNTAKKAMWLLYVALEGLGKTQLSARQISETFNKHFKQAGIIRVFNVTRDLGQLKVNSKSAPVSEDTTKTPSDWFLTDSGRKQVQDILASSASPK